MGFFSLHETCSCCGGETGFNKYKCKDGYLCSNCLKRAKKLKAQYNLFTMPGNILKEKFDEFDSTLEGFSETSNIGNLLLLDDVNKKIYIKASNGHRIIKYSDIIATELLENDDVKISSGGLGRAVAGGVLFGGAGAIVGGVTGKKKTNSIVKSLRIKISIKDKVNPIVYITLSKTEMKTTSLIYKGLLETAQKIIGALDCIISENNTILNQNPQPIFSTIEQLKGLKELLDSGVLTQEEFDNEKLKILNR